MTLKSKGPIVINPRAKSNKKEGRFPWIRAWLLNGKTSRGQIEDGHFSRKKQRCSNQLFILVILVPGETSSTKTTSNLIHNMDQIYLPTKPASGLNFCHPHIAHLKQGWFISNSPAQDCWCLVFLKHGWMSHAYPHPQDCYIGIDKMNHQGILSPYKS